MAFSTTYLRSARVEPSTGGRRIESHERHWSKLVGTLPYDIIFLYNAATLVFNPLTYAILSAVGWRLTYTVYAGCMLGVGIPAGLTFRGKCETDHDQATTEGQYEDIEQVEHLTIQQRSKIIIGTLWLIASTLKAIAYYTPYILLVKQMLTLGISQKQASNAMMAAGVSEVFSRVLASYGGDYVKGKTLYIYVAFTFALGIQNILGAFAYSYIHLVIYTVGLGILGGPIIAAMYSSCAEVLLGKEVPFLFSTFRVGLGIGVLLGPTLSGSIYDTTKSFRFAFILNAFCYFVCSFMYALIIYLNKKRPAWCFPSGDAMHPTNEQYPLANQAQEQSTKTNNQQVQHVIRDQDGGIH